MRLNAAMRRAAAQCRRSEGTHRAPLPWNRAPDTASREPRVGTLWSCAPESHIWSLLPGIACGIGGSVTEKKPEWFGEVLNMSGNESSNRKPA